MVGKGRAVCRLCLRGTSLEDVFEATNMNDLISNLLAITAIVTSSSGKKRYVYDCKQTYRKQLVECAICQKKLPKTRFDGHRNVHLGLRPWNCERGLLVLINT
uniref:C2H2-type domain-containing protein n=1 Tax=Anopheles merus TaxID=30066 RepID=A0A182VJ34_ANOME